QTHRAQRLDHLTDQRARDVRLRTAAVRALWQLAQGRGELAEVHAQRRPGILVERRCLRIGGTRRPAQLLWTKWTAHQVCDGLAVDLAHSEACSLPGGIRHLEVISSPLRAGAELRQ